MRFAPAVFRLVVASCGPAYELIAGALQLSHWRPVPPVFHHHRRSTCLLWAADRTSRFIVPRRRCLASSRLNRWSAPRRLSRHPVLVYAFLTVPFKLVLYGPCFPIKACRSGWKSPVMRLLENPVPRPRSRKCFTFYSSGALRLLLFPCCSPPSRHDPLSPAVRPAQRSHALWDHLAVPRSSTPSAAAHRVGYPPPIPLAALSAQTNSPSLPKPASTRRHRPHRNHPYQRIVLTRWKDDYRLFLNGNLQFFLRRIPLPRSPRPLLVFCQFAGPPAAYLYLWWRDGPLQHGNPWAPQIGIDPLADLLGPKHDLHKF